MIYKLYLGQYCQGTQLFYMNKKIWKLSAFSKTENVKLYTTDKQNW